jgi:hypothetical protein
MIEEVSYKKGFYIDRFAFDLLADLNYIIIL